MEPQPAQIESRVNQRFSNSPIFHWTKRFLLIFTAYISLYLLAKLIFFGIAYFFNSLNCDPCWITGILYLLIFLPFFPLLFLEQFLIYFGVGEFWSVTNLWSVAGLYLLGLIAAILLGLLFGGIRNKKISGGILIGTAVIAFLAYQIFVQDIFSQWASSNTETSSNLDLTKTEQKKSDLNTSTKSSVKSGWKVYVNHDLKIKFEYPDPVSTEFVAYMEDGGGDNILGIRGVNWNEGSDSPGDFAIFAKGIVAKNAEEAATNDVAAIKKNWAGLLGELKCSISETTFANLPAVAQVCVGPRGNAGGIYIKHPRLDWVVRINHYTSTHYINLSDQVIATFEFID